jgi:hypothetical protein
MGRFDDDLPNAGSSTPTTTPPDIPRITVTPRRGRFDDDLPPPRKEQGWGDYLKEGAVDFATGVGNTGTFGMDVRRDALSGWIAGDYPSYPAGVEAEQKKIEKQRERSPYATTAGNVAGGVGAGVAVGSAGVGVNIAGRAAQAVPMWLAKAMGFGTEGAIVGGAQGAGQTYTGNAADYAANAGKGAAIGGVLGGTAGQFVPNSAVQMRAGSPVTGRPIVQPTEAQLLALSNRSYQNAARIPVTYPGSQLQGTLSQAESQLMAQNVAPEQAQTVMRIIERVRNHPGSISPAQLDGIRQSLNNMKNVPTPGAEKAGVAAAILRDSIDDMMQHGSQHASNPALARQAAQWIERGRGDRAAMFRSQQLTDPAANAALKAQTGGPPVGEQLVPRGQKLLETKRGEQPNTRGWVDEERARVAAAITPTVPERAANFAADYLGRDIPALVGGKAASNMLRGWSARGLENRWNEAAQAMRGRSPAYNRALQGAVPVAGPGMSAAGQGFVGAGATELGTPYNDGRASIAEQLMRQGMMP